jgi:mannonate dehydratase
VLQDGAEDRERSPFHTPNEYVLAVAREHPEVVPCVSIHPYRLDAVERLRAAAAAGARAVKWVPNTMGIDPSSPRCDDFYRALAELRLPLVTHAGREQAIPGAEQELGNPLRLRRALDAGVRVVATHAASLGESLDLDAPAGDRKSVPSFDLFLRLAGEPQWEGILFADISAIALAFRSGRPLRELLRREDLHPRLLNGSDYPLPAIRWMTNLGGLVRSGVLDEGDVDPLDEMRTSNPLLFDLVLKRRLRLVEGTRAYRFPASVFETASFF